MKDQVTPLVSIITPTYNAVDYVSETIQSVLDQTYQNWELLITDDCSTDQTWDLLQEYSLRDVRVKLFKLEENQGPGLARNNSIEKAGGAFIAFLDSDDLWVPHKLQEQIGFMLDNHIDLCYSSYDLIDQDGKDLKKRVVAKEKVDLKDMLKSNYIGCSTAVYNSERIGKVYMPSIRKRQDYGLWVEILKKVKIAYGIKEPLVLYRTRPKSVSSNKLSLVSFQWKFYYEVMGLNFLMATRSMIYWFVYSVFGIKNRGR